MRLILFLVLFSIFAFSPDAYAFREHHSFEVEALNAFPGPYDGTLIVERAFVYDESLDNKIERIQIRLENDWVIAFTPTRLTAVPLCLNKNFCWVFMWKTVYPLPAIYKFIPRDTHWWKQADPYMRYSRRGAAYRGFKEKFNPVIGLAGVLLLVKKEGWYFTACILWGIILCLQIAKYHDLLKAQKKWIRWILNLMFIKSPLPIEPYMITAMMVTGFAWKVGGDIAGIPYVLSVIFIAGSLLMCALRIAHQRRNGLIK